MYTIKPVLDTIKPVLDTRRKLSSGEYPIKIRITVSQRSIYLSLGLSVASGSWSKAFSKVKASHPHHVLYNARIRQKYLFLE